MQPTPKRRGWLWSRRTNFATLTLNFDKKQLKGNIYLAKVTRVEPSLQAAFVDYGGNRHGFLAFSEIHPDYYQIPQADREMLERLELETAQAIAAEDDHAVEEEASSETDNDEDTDDADTQPVIVGEYNAGIVGEGDETDEAATEAQGETASSEDDSDDSEDADPGEEAAKLAEKRRKSAVTEDADEETADVVDAQARMRARLLRSYKIQEVIKRRQILLVQVVKEERGNKGAALTTYLSLAGRYCVLMPNTPRGGGISRKIANANDRRRLKTITQEMEVPDGMGLIVRTAGQQRSKSEIKRDYDFLLRQWSDIRDRTLESVAPSLIYAEGDLIKRAMRDLYTRDLEEVLVEGEEGYRAAKRLMQMMMPSRARNVKQYKDELPLFYRYRVEDQLDAMHSPTVHLPSGGSIVIHTTEALIAIDVNSGRSTRERHIDETAVKTNLEAAEEVARQLRLRDLAGLIVIDFIDMSEMRHQRQVERRFREALKVDRARVQVGKISMFGLMELSRQRLRASLQELASQSCPTCLGLGVIRSTESCALQALRTIQEEGIRNESEGLQLTLPRDVGLYVLNNKREAIFRLEERYDLSVSIAVDDDLIAPNMELETVKRSAPVDSGDSGDEAEAGDSDQQKSRDGQPQSSDVKSNEDEEEGRKRRRRRRRRRKKTGENGEENAAAEKDPTSNTDAEAGEPTSDTHETPEDVPADPADAPQPSMDEEKTKPRQRRRRRTRRPKTSETPIAETAEQPDVADPVEEDPSDKGTEDPKGQEQESVEAVQEPEIVYEVPTPSEPDWPEPVEQSEAPAMPLAAAEPELDQPLSDNSVEAAPEITEEPSIAEPADEAPARKGWWSRWVR